MKQQYGRANSGGVRHIVQSEKGYREGDYRRALCGKNVMVIPLAFTIGDTCRLCLAHPDYNRQETKTDLVDPATICNVPGGCFRCCGPGSATRPDDCPTLAKPGVTIRVME